MTDNFTVLQYSYGVFVAILTVNWEFFADIATASFDVFSFSSTASSLVVTVCVFLFVAVAGSIVIHGYCAMPPAFIRDPAFIWYTVGLHQAFIRDQRLLETSVY